MAESWMRSSRSLRGECVRRSRRSKLVFAGRGLPGTDRDDRGVPVPAAVGHRPVAEDAAAGVRHAAAVRVVADAGELCRRAGTGRLPAGLRQQPGGVLGRGGPVDLRRRSRGIRLRALPVPRRLVPVLLAAGHAHAAADRGAGADVHPVQQVRPDHDAVQRGPGLQHVQPAAGGVDHARLLRGSAARTGGKRLGGRRLAAMPRSAMWCCR